MSMMRPIIPYKIKTLCIRFYAGPWPGAKRQSLKKARRLVTKWGNSGVSPEQSQEWLLT